MDLLAQELKKRIVESLKLREVNPDEIDDNAPLFGAGRTSGGLNMDSIDALELVVMLEKYYGIVIKDIEEGRPAFQSVRALADFVRAKRTAAS